MNTIGERIRHLREQAGLTPFDLSIRSGIREQNIRNWETGRKLPSVVMVPALAEALDTTSDYLLSGQQPEPATSAAE